MRRIVLMISLLSIFLVSSAGIASAQYNSQNDQTINIITPLNLPTTGIASFTFNAQQSIHQTLFNTTGASVNYYYIWVNVNGQPVAAVDPAKAMY